MKKVLLIVVALFSVNSGLFGQLTSDDFFNRSITTFELGFGDTRSINNWSLNYSGEDSLAAGFNFNGLNRSNTIAPAIFFQDEYVFGPIFLNLQFGFSLTRDKNNVYGIGLGYQQDFDLGKYTLGVRLAATYNYMNTGVWAGIADTPEGQELSFGGRNFLRDRVVVHIGNRVHQIRPRVGLCWGIKDVQILLEGWYGAQIGMQERVYVRGRGLFPRRNSEQIQEPGITVTDAAGNSLTQWDFSQQFGIQLGIVTDIGD